MRHGFRIFVGALVVVSAASAQAQSLGDIAKKEEARRKDVAKPAKTYTNESLKASDRPDTAGQVAPPASSSSQASPEAPAAAPEADSGKHDQKYWHDKMTHAKDGLERSKTFAEALQSRINALTADFTSRDDPYQRQVVGQNRDKALAELDRVKKDIAGYEKEIRDTEEQARRAGVPPGWLR
jgi:hypothetical protein